MVFQADERQRTLSNPSRTYDQGSLSKTFMMGETSTRSPSGSAEDKPVATATFQLLQRLPEELLQDVLERLDRPAWKSLGLVSRWGNEITTPFLCKEVTLQDCETAHDDGVDQHDDTPLIRKLVLFSRKPHLASCIQVLTHQCHLPPPAIFYELPRCPFSSQTLSTHPGIIRLIKSATQHMTRLHTLRIMFGHPNVNDALLRCLFDKHRQKKTPIRKLWLENCRISAGCNPFIEDHPFALPLILDFSGLESVRFRRMPLRPGQPWSPTFPAFQIVHSRGSISGATADLQDGRGGSYAATINSHHQEQIVWEEQQDWSAAWQSPSMSDEDAARLGTVPPLRRLFQSTDAFDRRVHDGLCLDLTVDEQQNFAPPGDLAIDIGRYERAYRGSWLDPANLETHEAPVEWKRAQREKLSSSAVALHLLSSASQTVTSLNLDWVFTNPPALGFSRDATAQQRWAATFSGLFSLRLPHLRAFQFRNAVTEDTQMPHGLYLLDHSRLYMHNGGIEHPDTKFQLDADAQEEIELAGLRFMEAHQNLQCLAWPMDHFFSEKMPAATAARAQAVIENLARTLVDLRVDFLYSGNGELQSESVESLNPAARERRRKFIEYFVANMTKVESFKIEGGIPRDERREAVRALHASPLKKIVMIGVCSPTGNTWGANGQDLAESLAHEDFECLEAEDKDAIWTLGPMKPEPLPEDFRFEASYGWPSGPPMLNTLVQFHGDTIEELKFCGYKGSPILLGPTPITTPMLSALKHFHNLRSIITSLWLSTFFEGAPRDMEIISYWLNARSPASTALVRVTDEQPEGWERELRTKFAPDALAWRIVSVIGPFLSEKAKARRDGVHVRASFCIGDQGGIFDVDLRIGKGAMGSDVCLMYQGPREELEPLRRKSKLESRRWF